MQLRKRMVEIDTADEDGTASGRSGQEGCHCSNCRCESGGKKPPAEGIVEIPYDDSLILLPAEYKGLWDIWINK